MSDPFKYFRVEARELVEQIGRCVLELERSPSVATVRHVLRHAHTLKGAARVVRQTQIADRAHAIEDTLEPFREDATALGRTQVTRLLALADEITQAVASLDAPVAQAPQAPVVPKAVLPEAPTVVHADRAELDALLEGVYETHARLTSLRAVSAEIVDDEAAGPFAASFRKLDTHVDHVARELAQIRDHAENLRLVAPHSLFVQLERTARDAAIAVGKQVTLRAAGTIRLEAPLLVQAQHALVQLVRNAVAHGIETPVQRTAAGKPPAGTITIDVARRGRHVTFTCTDDGRGIDAVGVRAEARRRGTDVDALDDQQLLGVLLRGGISTSREVTEVAGRGIGLDLVREVAAQLGGEIRAHSVPGRGTTFELVVPASATAIEALVVEAGGSRALVPLEAVRATRRIASTEIARRGHEESITESGHSIAYSHLAVLLDERAPLRGADVIVVIVGTDDAQAAIGIDRVLGVGTEVIGTIPAIAGAAPVVAGVSLDVAGTPVLVLDPAELVAAARRARAIERPSTPEKLPLLVIDDSLTTRMLEKTILESAGYDVDTAVDAEAGLVAVKERRYALILVDVEMPGMDGFTFVERIRADAALRDIPAILVTSRAAPEDRRRGTEVGAQGYIVKSEFDQVDLLARIERMVAR
jgi:two-component system, chemotaxis family, sensor kinase CheA